MKTMRSLTLAVATAMLLAGTAVAQDKITIAGVIPNTQDPFWVSIGCGAQAEANEIGVELKLFSTTTMDAAPLTAAFNAALLTNPQGIFANPANANQFVTQYQDLMARGIPVVTANATEPPAQYKVLWATGDTAPYLADTLKLITADSGKMVVLGGIAGLVPLEVRYVPFVKALKEAKPGLTELEPIYSFFDVNKAQSALSAVLVANPDLKIIVASNGPDGIAAAAAVKAAGLAGQVTVIIFDAIPPGVGALKEGVVTALIAQAPFAMGAAQVDALVDYIKGGHTGAVPVSTELEGIPLRLLTKDNVDDPANADYVYKASCD